MMIDLHTHTSASDGTLGLEELVAEARRAGLKALAVTDHDTIQSAARMRPVRGIRLIRGVELTVFDERLGYEDVHVLGLSIDPAEKRLAAKLSSLEKARERQKKDTVRLLRELGYSITFAEVKAEAAGSVGRPHIARVLMRKYPGEFPSVASAFDKLLARGRKAYIGRETGFSLREAAALVKGAGGLSFVAHPLLYPYDSEELLADFKEAGGDGVETYYDYVGNRPAVKMTKGENDRIIRRYRALARDLGLLESGGSDFHGANKGTSLGSFGAPDALLATLESAGGKPF